MVGKIPFKFLSAKNKVRLVGLPKRPTGLVAITLLAGLLLIGCGGGTRPLALSSSSAATATPILHPNQTDRSNQPASVAQSTSVSPAGSQATPAVNVPSANKAGSSDLAGSEEQIADQIEKEIEQLPDNIENDDSLDDLESVSQ